MTTATTTPMHAGDNERRLLAGNTNKRPSSQSRNNMDEEGVGGEDRISRLPEALIHRILSLLPTKCAVSTTVLSKGWKNLWISVHVLDFRKWNSPNTLETQSSTERFMDFVDRVLFLRNMSDIKSLCLTCNGKYFDYQRVKAWISTAIKCGVEELIVCRRGAFGGVYMIPVDLYTCESLTLLDIKFYGDDLCLPQTISFPRLKILRLTDISFCTQQLFSGCPVLEELSLTHCTWNDLSFISSTLKVLTIMSTPIEDLGFCTITKIYAPNLMSIRIEHGIRKSLVVDSFPSLVYADIFGMCSEPRHEVDVISNFVKKLSNVKHLKLLGFIFESMELANILSTGFPTFISLITLEVSLIMKAKQVRALFSFLQFSPNLESLVIGQVIVFNEVNEYALTLDVVPHCLLMHLKSIKFPYFRRQQRELDLVRLFLQNARVLQTVILDIPPHYTVNSEEEEHTAKDAEDFSNKIMEQLLKYKWASSDCVIKIQAPRINIKPIEFRQIL